jgi:DnaJ-class molecular chaperone
MTDRNVSRGVRPAPLGESDPRVNLNELASGKCTVCHGTGRTNNHVTGEVECSGCDGSGVEP